MAERGVVQRDARRLGDALCQPVDWSEVSRLEVVMLVKAIAQVAPFDVSAKQALLEAETLDSRADLLVQLMQFLRLSQGGADLQPTLQ
jgi:Lon protease-like protein